MIHFNSAEGVFNFRSVAVIVHQGYVLLHQQRGDDFWALPGGRVEWFEDSATTVVREIREELGQTATVVRPLWHVENFFGFEGKRFHELSTYYLMVLVDSNLPFGKAAFLGVEKDVDLTFQWFPIDELASVPLYPEFLREKLKCLPQGVEFIRVNELADELPGVERK